MSLPIKSIAQYLGFKAEGFSVGRFLGGWVGFLLTPLWPMLKWIFSPFFPMEGLSSHSISISTFLQLNTVIQHLDAGILVFRVLPQLLVCLGVCVFFSSSFCWLGELLQNRIKQLGV